MMHIPPGRDMHQTGHPYPHRLKVLIMWRILYVYIYDRCEEVPVWFEIEPICPLCGVPVDNFAYNRKALYYCHGRSLCKQHTDF